MRFFLSVWLYRDLCWWISMYWTIPASMRLSLLDRDWWSFWHFHGFRFWECYCIFYINIHKGNWQEDLLLCLAFVWLSYRSNCGFIEWIGWCFSLSVSFDSLKSVDIFLVWWFDRNPSGSGYFLVGSLLMNTSISLGVMGQFIWYTWF